jgi:hypothetical protein
LRGQRRKHHLKTRWNEVQILFITKGKISSLKNIRKKIFWPIANDKEDHIYWVTHSPKPASFSLRSLKYPLGSLVSEMYKNRSDFFTELLLLNTEGALIKHRVCHY